MTDPLSHLPERAHVIVLGATREHAAALRAGLEPEFIVDDLGDDASGVACALAGHRRAVVLVRASADLAAPLLDPGSAPLIVMGSEWPPARPGVELPVPFFASPSDIEPGQLRRLIESALARRDGEPEMIDEEEAGRLASVIAAAQRLSGPLEPWAAAAIAEEVAVQLTSASRAYCHFFDDQQGELWRPIDPERTAISTPKGFVGWVARTGEGLRIDRADPRHGFVATVDDPDVAVRARSDLGAHLLLEPVTAAQGQVHAVLVVVREPDRPAFGEREVASLRGIAEQFGAALHRHVLRERADTCVRGQAQPASPIREEAWRRHLARGASGELLRVGARWPGVLLWLLLMSSASAVALSFVARVSRYSTGPALVQTNERRELTTIAEGTVSEILVRAGDEVRAGQIVARLHDHREAAHREQLDARWRASLRRYLAEPGNGATQTELLELRASLEDIEAQLDERVIRAPADGRVVDLRVHPGQRVEAGEVIAAVVEPGPADELIAFLPGADAPQLEPSMPLRFEVEGYPFSAISGTVVEVSDGVLSRREALRHLGPGAPALELRGPVVVVRARLEQPMFTVDEHSFALHDGMLGRVELRTHRERLAVALLPWLRRLGRVDSIAAEAER